MGNHISRERTNLSARLLRRTGLCAASILIGLQSASERKCAGSSAMPEPELFLVFVRPLNRAGIRYIEGENIVLAPPEYVIVRKLEYFREGHADKHLRDIRAMLAVSAEQLDHAALSKWIQQRGLEAEWRQAST